MRSIDFVNRVLDNFYEKLNVMPPTSDEELESYLNRARNVGLLDHDEVDHYLRYIQAQNIAKRNKPWL